ncbi:MAG: 4-hydroxybenzoyl-CoA thioesterase [Hydrogenophaga sp. SCN 70-13]|uniref:YbgC/FadM family acyl-CoA thioesterase n=1 Tax=unclassified Hydrogenophaga TaxID=2610897 RepID=UPI000869AC71|nr:MULTISPECIES: YbgC/FadM family acyl-CoA thioesterase [unclassified Hydrogenophaga]MBN9372107.1 YbgC/FadM family acyl-CoA thioesterase [Hydrogenophaga sp.]ODT32923.1 MAG: 4-hydroxybenzoyl-CoA thioesterase [Hydrogenophaga sp. SCN 70-13]OJV72694.1 MAG: 4-hydroxybenzoyl-CoA thioesterase [Hydrogenophaga sp. 70-12]
MTRLSRDDFRFFHRLRVRWAEVDMQKIVFNAHYLMYFDTAISDYWRALALPYEETMHSLEGDLYVVKATVEYHASARADEQIDVAMKCGRVGTSSMAFTGAIFRGDEHLITGEIVYVFADPATQRSRPVPDSLRAILLGHEAGEDMVDLRVGAWAELGEGASQLRAEVFVREQGIPLELEMDAADADAVHAVARNRLGRVVATGRLLRGEAPGVSKIGRMAVHRVLRGGNLGRRVLFALMDAARARGDREVRLHAQRSAVGFYARLGFVPLGEAFEEAGIPHQTMVKAL